MVSYQLGIELTPDGRVVLILVVMEDGLVPLHNTSKVSTQQSLNPCCDGRWSRTCCLVLQSHLLESVLILVVMEDGLVPI